MSIAWLALLGSFAFVSSITPGPNNLMLMASGTNHGLRRTLPHMLGVTGGFAFMLSVVGAGIGQLIVTYPAVHWTLKIAGSGYLLYLAWRIATSQGPSEAHGDQARPFTFWEAAAFQWVNPKAWAMGLTTVSAYTVTEAPVLSLAVMVAVVSAINFPCITVWTLVGTRLRRWLAHPKKLRAFNIVAALLLVATLYPMLR